MLKYLFSKIQTQFLWRKSSFKHYFIKINDTPMEKEVLLHRFSYDFKIKAFQQLPRLKEFHV